MDFHRLSHCLNFTVNYYWEWPMKNLTLILDICFLSVPKQTTTISIYLYERERDTHSKIVPHPKDGEILFYRATLLGTIEISWEHGGYDYYNTNMFQHQKYTVRYMTKHRVYSMTKEWPVNRQKKKSEGRGWSDLVGKLTFKSPLSAKIYIFFDTPQIKTNISHVNDYKKFPAGAGLIQIISSSASSAIWSQIKLAVIMHFVSLYFVYA